MSSCISLPTVSFGDVVVRLIFARESEDGSLKIMHPTRDIVNKSHMSEMNCIPLFLARDVYNLVDPLATQRGVCLSKFLNRTKDSGFNTRLHFNGVSVRGINNSSTIYFVGINTFFMELVSRKGSELKKMAAIYLWDTWKMFSEVTLPADLHYTGEVEGSVIKDAADIESKIKPLDELVHCMDMNQQHVEYRDNLRSLLNSYRSLHVRYGSAGFNKFISKEEDLVQSLLSHPPTDSTDIDEAILEVASGWIGREFNTMKPVVQQSITKFKTDNIKSIARLPSSQDTCSHFPRAMVTLFENWLSAEQVNQPSNVDDITGEPVLKHRRCASSDMYPFIQLLLEFANNSLISGVAHVVYTQLLKDPT